MDRISQKPKRSKTAKPAEATTSGIADAITLGIQLDGEIVACEPAQLTDPAFAEDLRKKCERAKQAEVSLVNLLQFADSERFVVLDFCRTLSDVQFQGRDVSCKEILAAVLQLQPEGDFTSQLRWKLAALEAAALTVPLGIDLASHQICEAAVPEESRA